jgi:lipoprotein-anchoring transpeptidase ErfK/SrfK
LFRYWHFHERRFTFLTLPLPDGDRKAAKATSAAELMRLNMTSHKYGTGAPLQQKRLALLALAGVVALASGLAAGGALAAERYKVRTHVGVSPDLMAPWVLQLQRNPQTAALQATIPQLQPRTPAMRTNAFVVRTPQNGVTTVKPRRVQVAATGVAGAAPRSAAQAETMGRTVDPMWLPQIVDYATNEKPGTIVIDTNQRFLYLVMGEGQARRYGVGVGKPGFEWAGTHKVSRKAEWPDWRPPAEMRERERKKGRNLPVHMAGGPENPLGARAMYLGSTLYRIHGTNQPWSIGGAVSSGCIRMRNEDVIDLYERVKIGTKVRVI